MLEIFEPTKHIALDNLGGGGGGGETPSPPPPPKLSILSILQVSFLDNKIVKFVYSSTLV
jgi:hypothetical protein